MGEKVSDGNLPSLMMGAVTPETPKHTHMKISFHGTELKIEAVTIRNSENVDSLSLSPYALSEDGNQAQPCEIDNAEFWRILKKDSLGRVSVVADIFVY